MGALKIVICLNKERTTESHLEKGKKWHEPYMILERFSSLRRILKVPIE